MTLALHAAALVRHFTRDTPLFRHSFVDFLRRFITNYFGGRLGLQMCLLRLLRILIARTPFCIWIILLVVRQITGLFAFIMVMEGLGVLFICICGLSLHTLFHFVWIMVLLLALFVWNGNPFVRDWNGSSGFCWRIWKGCKAVRAEWMGKEATQNIDILALIYLQSQ